MEKHLIALDLDGTLLSDQKTISERNKQAIHKAREAGHIVCIATGRPHRASIDYYNEMDLDTPMVNFNGALIHHPLNHNWDSIHSPMSIRTAREIIHTCHEIGVRNILAEVRDEVYLDQYDQEILDIFHTTDTPITIGSIKNHLNEDPTSILIHPNVEQVKHIREHLDEKHATMIEHRKWGAPWHVIEIVRAGLNKAVGLNKIAHYYHIPKERVIAFGDEDNDLEMLEFAGVGVAMDNAISELKDVSNEVTTSNEQDGIAVFLEQYLKLT
ncbi:MULTISPECIES: Cof-type HAD-IIB family hydrolase [Pontibacillus]|uniref:Cof-type HAD-IIB family hydrolase n=1 Tax=Pontibacillus chungwhensis TaxID=265426 RepID=A0ABY8V181_9BACI|nr:MULTISPECIES: Cof-type HAD-IIB family hydrolase [Pontibacillus]MCD5324710.1 Cof-type HAD-IIB family hydrolase [Pontibacillus sp. HN14]WIF98997.1 Cof-type HAD-IIB family hydrolase [Pontibacillus chungwhensis]